MSQSFSDFLEFVFHEKDKYRDDARVNKHIYSSTLNKMRVICLIFATMELVALFASILPKHAHAPYVVAYRYIYFALFAIMVFGMIILSYVKLDVERRSSWLK